MAPLQDSLTMSKGDGKKGSQLRVVWCADAETAFESTKVALCETFRSCCGLMLRVELRGRGWSSRSTGGC